MAKKRQLHYSKTTQQGDNTCPECDGDCVILGDYEQGKIDIDVTPCHLCNGKGTAEIGKDYNVNVEYTQEGPLYEIIPIFKEDKDYDSNR